MKESIQECTTYDEILELEDSEDFLLRRDAFRNTENWVKAEDDKDYTIRMEAFDHTKNWEKAENDENAFIRIEAFRYNKNWIKARHDDDFYIKEEAINYFHTQKIKQKSNTCETCKKIKQLIGEI